MNTFTIRDNQGARFLRVSKAKAARFYALGHAVAICPVNLHPFGGWNPSALISKLDGEYAADFAWRCDRYADQFPQDKECGRYLAYYVQADTTL